MTTDTSAAAKPTASKKSKAKPAPTTREALRTVGAAVSSDAAKAKQIVTAKASDNAKVAQEKFQDYKEKATEKMKAAAGQTKTRTSEAVGNVGKLIEDSARTIDENLGEKYGDYARTAAAKVSSFAETIETKDVGEMAEDVREFVRKKPAIAIGAAAVAGFVLARLFRSGSDE